MAASGTQVVLFIFGERGKEKQKEINTLPGTQDLCVSVGPMESLLQEYHNNTLKHSYLARKENCRWCGIPCNVGTLSFAPTPPISISRCLLREGCHQSDSVL